MIYKDFHGLRLSALGMGGMRLPVVNGEFARVDQAATEQMVDYALEQGVNYFDTAWGYHGGQSELALSQALSKYPRESYFLADKFPGYELSLMGQAESVFAQQLEKCRVDHFDFYLLHNVCELNIDEYLDPKYAVPEFFIRQRELGRIRHLGFSAHGDLAMMRRFLHAWGSQMEFCQIQLNYVDWGYQQAKEKVELLHEYHLPVWVMEPLRGGRLATLEPEQAARLAALRPDETVPGWAFRFVQGLPDVAVTLSGMSNLQQLKENIATFAEARPLNAAEQQALSELAAELTARNALPCTACRYCVSHCPQQLDIPYLLSLYNDYVFTKGFNRVPSLRIAGLPEDKRPSACLDCHSCEAVCPQQLKIPAALADFAARLKG